MKNSIIEGAIKNLTEYGYRDVNQTTIFVDPVYSAFFEKMLINNLGNDPEVDEIINELLDQIKIF